jgi:hypothetical protein
MLRSEQQRIKSRTTNRRFKSTILTVQKVWLDWGHGHDTSYIKLWQDSLSI